MPEISKEMMVTAALLHDIGKFMRRSGIKGKHRENSYDFIREKLATASFFSEEEIEYIALLARYHHLEKGEEVFLPEGKKNPFLKILMQADSDSASERNLEKEDSGSIETAPVSHILSAVDCALGEKEISKVLILPPQEFYPLMAPSRIENYQAGTGPVAEIYEKFERDFERLVEKSVSQEDFILRLQFLLKRYTSAVTSSGKENIRDISLYSHLYTTAALALCRYIDRKNGKDVFRDYTCKIFYGRFFDIQEYIFGSLNKNVEKPLKRILTRSMLITLINQLVPYQIVRDLGLYPCNIVFSGGGSFLILLPASLEEAAEKEAEKLKRKLAFQFENKVFLETVISDLSIREEGEYRLDEYFRGAFNLINRRKYLRTTSYINFDGENVYYRCPNCGINTREPEFCRACRLENAWMAVDMEHLVIPYEMMDLENITRPELFTDNGQAGMAFSLWQLKRDNIMDLKITGRTMVRKNPSFCSQCGEKEKCLIEEGEEISLNCFAYTSEHDDIIATAKIDVDDLGFIFYETYPFSFGGETYPFALSRLAFMSQLVDMFFSTGVKKLLEEKFAGDVVLLYSGGDDLLMSGRWNSVLRAALAIRESFNQFTAYERDDAELSLSAGIVFHASQKPFNRVLQEVEHKIEEAKKDKNCININGTNYTWWQAEKAELESDKIALFVNESKIPRKTLFAMIRLLEVRGKGETIRKARRAALFYYYAERNLQPGKAMSQEEAEKIRKILEDLVVKKDENDLQYSRLVLELAIRKTRGRRD